MTRTFSVGLGALAVVAAAGWFVAGAFSAREIMTPECRYRFDQTALIKGQWVKDQYDRNVIAAAESNLARECSARTLWGRL